mmetsp:Transcript_10229/g.15462  ORF Transcript_10229/g.15462 Transcript_10229/m.15462 type:complete len:839 (-) Transcript_10229:321-2837(-)
MLRKRKNVISDEDVRTDEKDDKERKDIHDNNTYGSIVMVCGGLFVCTLIILTTIIREERKGVDTLLNQRISLCTGSSFLTSFVLRCLNLLLDMCNSKKELISDNSRISFAILTIHGVATITHFSIGLGLFPVIHSSGGRRYHVVRFAEWISLVPLMIFVLHSYDEESLIDSHQLHPLHPGTLFCYIFGPKNVKNTVQFLNKFSPFKYCLSSLGPNSKASLFAQFFATFIGLCPTMFDLAGYTLPPVLTWCLYLISTILFCNLFFVFYTVVSTRKTMFQKWEAESTLTKNDSVPRLIQRIENESKGSEDSSQEYYTLLAMYERRSRASRLVLLCTICTIVWTMNVLFWFGGVLNMYSPQTETILYSATDVSSKNVFVSALGESATRLIAVESALTKLLAIEKAATKYRRKFLRYVMHEVRVPLNSIKLGLSTINDIIHDYFFSASSSSTTVGKEVKNLIKIVDQSIDSMASTLNDVLSFAAIEEGKFDLNCSKFNPVDMVNTVVAMHEATAKSKNMKISVNINHDQLNSIQLYGDNRRLAACVSNFISNAIKFSKIDTDNSYVEITVSSFSVNNIHDCTCLPSENQSNLALGLMIQVKDNGIGIATEEQPLLFKAFSQIRPNENQRGRGSGLGLAISREIAERHGGSIGLKSSLGQGSTFFIRVPLVVLSSTTPVRSSQSDAFASILAPQPTKQIKNNLSALVVDDCEVTRKLLSAQIQRIGFNIIVQAENGVEAIKACGYDDNNNTEETNYPFDVIFLDYCMPICTGPECASILRANQCKSVIIGVTGNALEEDIALFISAGADSILTKPVSRRQIIDKLDEYKSRVHLTTSITTSSS